MSVNVVHKSMLVEVLEMEAHATKFIFIFLSAMSLIVDFFFCSL
jgi:hypothetical protein